MRASSETAPTARLKRLPLVHSALSWVSRRNPAQHRDRSQDGKQSLAVLPFAERAADVNNIALRLNPVDVSQVADVPPDLRLEERLEVFRAAFLDERIGVIFVRDGEFEPIDHFTHTRSLLRGPVHDHGFVGGGNAAGERDCPFITGTDSHRKLRGHRPARDRGHDAPAQVSLVEG